MTIMDQDPRTIPGAMLEQKDREIPGMGLIEFEQAPAGWLTKKGEPRHKDWRAYHFTPDTSPCGPCEGTGRVAGKTANGKQCPDCKGAGETGKRSRLPSVTTLLDAICPKGGLPVWAEARGIEGAIEAVRRGIIDPDDPASAAMAVDLVRSHQLGADRARDTAAERGLNVHACLEHYMLTGEPPNPADSIPEHHGYLRALTRWLLDVDPEPEAVESLVCHPEDGYAGRLDLRAHIGGTLYTADVKTQEKGGIYLAAHAQVNLYERAARRCGDTPAERLLVVVFADNGEYREMNADHPDAFTDAALGWMRHGRPVDLRCANLNAAERRARSSA